MVSGAVDMIALAAGAGTVAVDSATNVAIAIAIAVTAAAVDAGRNVCRRRSRGNNITITTGNGIVRLERDRLKSNRA